MFFPFFSFSCENIFQPQRHSPLPRAPRQWFSSPCPMASSACALQAFSCRHLSTNWLTFVDSRGLCVLTEEGGLAEAGGSEKESFVSFSRHNSLNLQSQHLKEYGAKTTTLFRQRRHNAELHRGFAPLQHHAEHPLAANQAVGVRTWRAAFPPLGQAHTAHQRGARLSPRRQAPARR